MTNLSGIDKETIVERLRDLQDFDPSDSPADTAAFFNDIKMLSEEDIHDLASWYRGLEKSIRYFCTMMKSKKNRDDFQNHPMKFLRESQLTDYIKFYGARIKMVKDYVKSYDDLHIGETHIDEAKWWACFLCVGVCLLTFFAIAVLGVAVSIWIAAPAAAVISIILGIAVDIVLASITLQIGMAALTVARFMCQEFDYCK